MMDYILSVNTRYAEILNIKALQFLSLFTINKFSYRTKVNGLTEIKCPGKMSKSLSDVRIRIRPWIGLEISSNICCNEMMRDHVGRIKVEPACGSPKSGFTDSRSDSHSVLLVPRLTRPNVRSSILA